MMNHLYADDMQRIKHGKPVDVHANLSAHEACITEAGSW
jgi:hypothetical protein